MKEVGKEGKKGAEAEHGLGIRMSRLSPRSHDNNF